MLRSYQVCTIALCMVGIFHSPASLKAQKLRPVVGFHGGINFTHPSVQQPYQIITLLDGDEPIETTYGTDLRNFGHQLGFSLYLDLNDKFSLGLLPQQANYTYNYASILEFVNSAGQLYSSTETQSTQQLSYINIPLVVKYTLRKSTWSPYFFGGFSYGILRSAQSNIITTSTQLAYNTSEEITTSNSSTQVFITSKLNLLGGLGVLYDLKQVLIGMEIGYWYGLNIIVNEGSRFSNQTISGYTYDVPSDIKLNQYALNLMVLFPINKITSRGSLDCVTFKKRR